MALHGMLWPRTVEEATALLAEDPEAKPIAGGATLVAMMNARVIEPLALVNLGRIDELRGIRRLDDGRVRIGAYTRHRETAECAELAGPAAVVRQAAGQIANATVRNMGTIGGSISFADPGLDYPPAIVAARAEVEIASAAGRRHVPAAEFFLDWYTTALEPGEIVTGLAVPQLAGWRSGFEELARRHGDFALAGLAARMRIERDEIADARLVFFGVGTRPVRARGAEAVLSGARASADALAAAGRALDSEIDPPGDIHGSPALRRHLARVLLARVTSRLVEGST
jgi:carbon-monoxide dehydrogenase medium subunit